MSLRRITSRHQNLAGDTDRERSLPCSPDQYLISVEMVPELVCVVENGRVIHVNSAGVRALGARSADDFKGRFMWDLLAPEYQELAADGFELLLAEAMPTPLKMVRLDSGYSDINLLVRRYSDSTNGPVVVIGHDITELKRSAIAVVERERRILAIMENIADGIVVIDDKGQIESFNHAAELMFDYAARDVIGQNVKLLMEDTDQERHDDYLRNYVRKTSETENVMMLRNRDFVGRRRNGSTFPMSLAVREMRSIVKHKFIASISDITERKQREAVLRQSETRLKEIVDNAPLQIALSNGRGQFSLVNKQFAEAHDADPDSLQGSSVRDLYSSEAANAHAAADYTVLESGKVHKLEQRVPDAEDGRY